MRTAEPSLARQCLAEFLGTFLLVLIGDGAVAVAVFTGALDLWGVVALWGLAVTLAIYSMGYLSGAHYNPAVTIALAAFERFPGRKVAPFIGCQVAGGFFAAAILYSLWRGLWQPAAARLGVAIGGPGSQKLAMVFSCYYPNPGIIGADPPHWAMVSTFTAFSVEMVLTAVLMIVILALGNPRNTSTPTGNLTPVFVGLAVTALVGIGAPLTMASLNPARDFGPRLFAAIAGFGSVAIPGPRGHEFWLFSVAPIAGALLGSAIYLGATSVSETDRTSKARTS